MSSFFRIADCCSVGSYVVTLCTYQRQPLLGTVAHGLMHANVYGRGVADSWIVLPDQFHGVTLDACVVMPSHVHAILSLGGRGASLGAVVRTWKAEAQRLATENGLPPKLQMWDPRYQEHMLRNDTELKETRSYIWNNAASWISPEMELLAG